MKDLVDASGELMARLRISGPVPVRSTITLSPLMVILQANLMRMFSFSVESTNWLNVTVPSGISLIRRRTSVSTSSTVTRREATNVSWPTSSMRRSTVSITRRTAPILTLMSASMSFGSRVECWRNVSRSRRRWPPSTILIGEARSPSSKGVSEPQGIPPGSQAPFSPSWMVAPTHAMITPSRMTGTSIDWSVLWTMPKRESLWKKPSPGLMPTVGSFFQFFMMYRIGWCRTGQTLSDAVDLQDVDAVGDALLLVLGSRHDLVMAHDCGIRSEEQRGLVHE